MTGYFLHWDNHGYPLLLVMILISTGLKRYQENARDLPSVINRWKAITGVIVLAFFIQEIASGNNQQGYDAFINRSTGPYWPFFWLSLTGSALLPQLFWVKKYRKSLTLSILVALLLCMEDILHFLTPFFRDYLPSSWTMKPAQDQWLDYILYVGLVTVTYWLAKWIKPQNTSTTIF